MEPMTRRVESLPAGHPLKYTFPHSVSQFWDYVRPQSVLVRSCKLLSSMDVIHHATPKTICVDIMRFEVTAEKTLKLGWRCRCYPSLDPQALARALHRGHVTGPEPEGLHVGHVARSEPAGLPCEHVT